MLMLVGRLCLAARVHSVQMEADDGKWELPSNPEWEAQVLQALGYLLVQANMLESALVDVYWLLSGKPKMEPLEKVRGKTLRPLYKLFLEAFQSRFPDGEMRRRLEKMQPEIEKAIATRNEFVHASWFFQPEKELMHRKRMPRDRLGERELRRFTVSEIQGAVEIVGGTARRIWEELYDPAVR